MAEKTKAKMREERAVLVAEIDRLKKAVEEGKKINNDNAVAYALTMKRCKGTIRLLRILVLIEFIFICVLNACLFLS